MSIDIDHPPINDPLTKVKEDYMSNLWISWISSFVQTVSEYLSQNGIFIPSLTTSQRNQIQIPVDGQLIYNSTISAPQFFQVSTNSWRTISFT